MLMNGAPGCRFDVSKIIEEYCNIVSLSWTNSGNGKRATLTKARRGDSGRKGEKAQISRCLFREIKAGPKKGMSLLGLKGIVEC